MTRELIAFLQERLQALADPARAKAMAAYMKTQKPFYGVPAPQRRAITKRALKCYPVVSETQYARVVRAVWELPQREAQYAALDLAQGYREFIGTAALPLYEQLIVEGAWWDLVDGVAPHLVGPLLVREPETVRPVLERWVQADDVWLRRSAIIAQLRLKEATDGELLFRYCTLRASDREFWVRKAIGWALREYGKIDPAQVGDYLVSNRDRLSPLSFKEGARNLV